MALIFERLRSTVLIRATEFSLPLRERGGSKSRSKATSFEVLIGALNAGGYPILSGEAKKEWNCSGRSASTGREGVFDWNYTIHPRSASSHLSKPFPELY
jgi:hypothetical protein